MRQLASSHPHVFFFFLWLEISSRRNTFFSSLPPSPRTAGFRLCVFFFLSPFPPPFPLLVFGKKREMPPPPPSPQAVRKPAVRFSLFSLFFFFPTRDVFLREMISPRFFFFSPRPALLARTPRRCLPFPFSPFLPSRNEQREMVEGVGKNLPLAPQGRRKSNTDRAVGLLFLFLLSFFSPLPCPRVALSYDEGPIR